MKFTWLCCLSIVFATATAWADVPSYQAMPNTPSHQQNQSHLDHEAQASKKVYRSKKLRINKPNDSQHRSHDKKRRFKDGEQHHHKRSKTHSD